jgi:hypothetical protein
VSTFLATAKHHISALRAIWWMFHNHPFPVFRVLLSEHLDAWKKMTEQVKNYDVLSTAEMLQKRTGKRVFVFGSGYSLNDIPAEEWARFSKEDSIGFSGSIYLQKLPLTYLLLRAWTETSAGSLAWQNDSRDVLDAIERNPFLADTVFVLPTGFTSIFTNRLVGFGLWNKAHAIGYYLPDKLGRFPHRNIESGIVHGKSTLCSAISLAVALQYDEIVLVGVDLYDSRYFWLEPDKTLGWSDAEKKLVVSDTTVRGAAVGSVHNTVNNGIVSYLGEWNSHIEGNYGARLSVYNPKSLLVTTLPLFQWN